MDKSVYILMGLLKLDNAKFSPESRYFLMLVANKYGDAIVASTVAAQRKELGVTDNFIKKGRDEALAAGYLTSTNIYSEGHEARGRPRKGYAFNKDFYNQLSELGKEALGSQGDHYFLTDILEVLDLAGERKIHGNIRIATRILLSLLLLKASRVGVVESLGSSDIRKLSGIGRDRLDSQVVILQREGYLEDYLSGGTSRFIFGGVKTIYFLDTETRFSGKSSSVKILELPNYVDARENEGSNLMGWVRVNEHKPINFVKDTIKVSCFTSMGSNVLRFTAEDLKKYANVVDFFTCVPLIGGVERRLLQAKIEIYASHLLSTKWAEMPELIRAESRIQDYVDSELFSRIEQEILLKKYYLREDGEFPSDEQIINLTRLVFELSLRLAQSIRAALIKVITGDNPIVFEDMEFCILPQFGKSNRTNRGCSIIYAYSDKPSLALKTTSVD